MFLLTLDVPAPTIENPYWNANSDFTKAVGESVTRMMALEQEVDEWGSPVGQYQYVPKTYPIKTGDILESFLGHGGNLKPCGGLETFVPTKDKQRCLTLSSLEKSRSSAMFLSVNRDSQVIDVIICEKR
jgi:hypothetical protein